MSNITATKARINSCLKRGGIIKGLLPFLYQKCLSADRQGGEMMSLFEIYFYDLKEDAQKRYLEFEGVDDPSELNAEYSPICVLERSDDDEADDEGDGVII